MIDGAVYTGMTMGGAKVYTYGFSETQVKAAIIGINAINNYLNSAEGGRGIGQKEYLLTSNPSHVGADAGKFSNYTSWNSMPGKVVTYYGSTTLNREDFNSLSEEIFHELVHAGWNSTNGHPMGGRNAEPHLPGFYLLMEAIVVANGGYLERFDSVEATKLYGKSRWFEHGGSPFENAVALDGLSTDEPKLLVRLRGTDAVSTLRDHLTLIGAGEAAARLEAQYETVFGASVPPTKCFPAHTRVQTSLTTSVAISTLRPGDIVLSYDARANKGRGGLVPRRVVRIYRNTTTEWVRLTWVEGGERRELVATPGHHFLDQFGLFPTIHEMTRTGRATVVLASGALAEVTAERIIYSAETAHLFERAVAHAAARKALWSRFDGSNDGKLTRAPAGRRGRGAGLTRRRGSRNIAVSRQGRGKTWLPASSRTACCISAIATSRARPITRPT